MTNKFAKLQSRFPQCPVALKRVTLQSYYPCDDRYDVVMLHNSVNHLDEKACISLLKEGASRAAYKRIFLAINTMMNREGFIILSDCSRYNFFPLLRLKNPFAPTIEWEKHQSPKKWAQLLEESGFVDPVIRWMSFNRLGNLGKTLSGNKVCSYFLNSFFSLKMKKQACAYTNSGDESTLRYR